MILWVLTLVKEELIYRFCT